MQRGWSRWTPCSWPPSVWARRPARLTLQPPLPEARFPRLTLRHPCPRTERGSGRLVPRPQREDEASLATTEAHYQVPHGALQLWLPVGCDKSKQTSCKPCRTGVGWAGGRLCGSRGQGALGAVAALQEDPGGEALERRFCSSDRFTVKWEDWGHCLPFKKSQRLREAQQPPHITQQQRPSWPPRSHPRAAGH